jgi:hypothetical protein
MARKIPKSLLGTYRFLNGLSFIQWFLFVALPTAIGGVSAMIAGQPLWFDFIMAMGAGGIALIVFASVRAINAHVEHQSSAASVPQSLPVSPIQVHEGFYADCDRLKDMDGNEIPDARSVAICLWVTNALETGEFLRNLQARYYYVTGEWSVLPIRGAQTGSLDLRHGEVAVIEVGRVLWSRDDNLLAMFRSGMPFQVIDIRELHNAGPEAQHRTIKISNALGESRQSVGQLDDEHRFSYMRVVISADDQVSKVIKLQTNLYAERPHEWLVQLPEHYEYERRD